MCDETFSKSPFSCRQTDKTNTDRRLSQIDRFLMRGDSKEGQLKKLHIFYLLQKDKQNYVKYDEDV